MAVLIITDNTLHKSGLEYHGKFGHNIGRIQHIARMNIIDIFYTACLLAKQAVVLYLYVIHQ